MTPSHRTLTAAVLAVAMTVAAPAVAQETEPDSPGAQAREGAEQILDALRGLLQMMPRYGMPRVQEDGDIVIPRLDEPENGDGEDGRPDDPGSGVTETRI